MVEIIVEVSRRHVHVADGDFRKLFGPTAELHVRRAISQTGQFAAAETVELIGSVGKIPSVRLVGPIRSATQVELSAGDAVLLGLDVPLRDSGDLHGSPGLTLVGAAGTVVLAEGAIRQRRHIHATPDNCQTYGVRPGSTVSVRVGSTVFDGVFVKVHPLFVWRLHIDSDEAAQAGVHGGESAEVIL